MINLDLRFLPKSTLKFMNKNRQLTAGTVITLVTQILLKVIFRFYIISGSEAKKHWFLLKNEYPKWF